MKEFTFPLTKTISTEGSPIFDLNDPVGRRQYFDFKTRKEIEFLKEYLRNGSFIAVLLGPKNSGKGTYSKLFMEAVGAEHIVHVSVGDIVRRVHSELEDPQKKEKLMNYLHKRYRGFVPVEDALDALFGRSTTTLLPTEIILALVEHEVDQHEGKAIFLDGFPRNLDQVSYSLYLRSLMGYRNDPDMFVFINLPRTIIDERMKYRVVCPICHTPRSLKLLRTKEIGYDADTKEFFLKCDTPSCNSARLVAKEGDNLGIEAIRDRIEADETVMQMVLGLQGVPKVYLNNAIPVSESASHVDAYEITPSYRYEWDEKNGSVRIIEEPWVISDDKGIPSYSLLPPAVVVSFIQQMAAQLGLNAARK